MRNQLTQDQPTLFMDQHGGLVRASSAKELHDKAGGGRIRKQYISKRSGDTMWNGYVIGDRWFTAFKWAEVKVP